jgi:hypothetical protein
MELAGLIVAERVLKILAVTLAVGFAALYVAAKVHFFTRFDPADLRAYWAEHWPYTAGLVFIAAAIWGVAALLSRRTQP